MLLIVLPVVVLVLAGSAYAIFQLTAPEEKPVNVQGTLVPLGEEFVVNLSGGHYGKVSVALLLSEDTLARLPQDAAVRAVITDELTGSDPEDLIDRRRRHRLVERLERALARSTDEPVKQVLLTDIAVQ
jgi:flagellar basal body-associated protein FliL